MSKHALTDSHAPNLGPLIKTDVRDITGNPISLRVVAHGADTLRALVGDKLNGDLPLLTLRIKGEVIVLTLRDLLIVP